MMTMMVTIKIILFDNNVRAEQKLAERGGWDRYFTVTRLPVAMFCNDDDDVDDDDDDNDNDGVTV